MRQSQDGERATLREAAEAACALAGELADRAESVRAGVAKGVVHGALGATAAACRAAADVGRLVAEAQRRQAARRRPSAPASPRAARAVAEEALPRAKNDPPFGSPAGKSVRRRPQEDPGDIEMGVARGASAEDRTGGGAAAGTLGGAVAGMGAALPWLRGLFAGRGAEADQADGDVARKVPGVGSGVGGSAAQPSADRSGPEASLVWLRGAGSTLRGAVEATDRATAGATKHVCTSPGTRVAALGYTGDNRRRLRCEV